MAQGTQLRPHGMPGSPYGSFAGKSGTTTVWVSLGDGFLYQSANFTTAGGTPSFFYEVLYRATTGTVLTRLYDVTADSAVADTEANTTAATFTRQRSIAITLTDGHFYRAQFGKAGFDAGEAAGAKIIAI